MSVSDYHKYNIDIPDSVDVSIVNWKPANAMQNVALNSHSLITFTTFFNPHYSSSISTKSFVVIIVLDTK